MTRFCSLIKSFVYCKEDILSYQIAGCFNGTKTSRMPKRNQGKFNCSCHDPFKKTVFTCSSSGSPKEVRITLNLTLDFDCIIIRIILIIN